MNKTAMGFGIGLVLIAAAAIGYLLVFGAQPEGTTAPDTAKAPAATPNAAPAPGEEVEPQPSAAATPPAPAAAQPEMKDVPPELAGLKEPPKIPQPEVVTPTKLSLTRIVPDAATFAEKETLDVTLRVEHVEGNDPVRAMGMQEQIPAGYALEAFSGPRQPEVKPPAGTRGVLEMAWIQFPADFFPAEFSYKLKKTGEVAPTSEISGQVLFRTSAEELRTDVVKSLLGTGAETSTTSAPSASPTPKPEAAPEQPAESATPDSTLELGRGVKGEGYTPGEPVEFELLLTHKGAASPSAIALVETLPPGWTFEAVTGGAAPPIKPQQGKEGDLSFIFIEVPAFPVTFSYTARPPADAAGDAVVKGQVVYRADNAPMKGAVLETTVKQK